MPNHTKIGLTLKDHIATLVPAFEAAECTRGQEHLLYEPWNVALSWLTFGRSTSRPSGSNPTSDKLPPLQVVPLARTRWQFTDTPDLGVVASENDEILSSTLSSLSTFTLSSRTAPTSGIFPPPDVGVVASENDEILSSTLSSLPTLTLSSRTASVALSQSNVHSRVDRDSYRIPDFAILSRTGRGEKLREQVPFIVEVKPHTIDGDPEVEFLTMMEQVVYQAKAVFSTYPEQQSLHVICAVGRYYKMLHLKRHMFAGVVFPDPSAEYRPETSGFDDIISMERACISRSLLNYNKTDYDKQWKTQFTYVLNKYMD
ncbi:hypothetical protein SERLA73DRAFT_75772 [Serpula lacrymans var. lacrymans S7.3]|uniref:Uncharacterized protein n=2 Tax=Serpula lacrymans var. lacrymans TaxID=341189 RepID=F8Q470_SERL3|nr:uncharacterized protein SERLADRAFT_440540 [Serpula lacrymans var. lacrymans S7.9]EGN96926.1 hypothetical protein SERLA73DRAFT_75772 [Serpula lacrymans var. lacrymans S7.3]EGO22519.1 hypothetical protein SERLADRAFT_440540 [Serpula lacrymans var. lacrymans S7.9]